MPDQEQCPTCCGPVRQAVNCIVHHDPEKIALQEENARFLFLSSVARDAYSALAEENARLRKVVEAARRMISEYLQREEVPKYLEDALATLTTPEPRDER